MDWNVSVFSFRYFSTQFALCIDYSNVTWCSIPLAGAAQDKKVEKPNGEMAKKDDNTPGESKSAKKKKKKDKSSKESKEQHDQANGVEAANGTNETDKGEDASTSLVKDKIKKVASLKKKKSSKEVDAAAKAAASEAAARNARLAAAKKKEKSHYNQQPLR